MKLPDTVLTFKLLDGANDECKLALILCSGLNFDKMKSALKRPFSKSSLNPNDNVKIKQEAFYSKSHEDFNIQNLMTNLNKSPN